MCNDILIHVEPEHWLVPERNIPVRDEIKHLHDLRLPWHDHRVHGTLDHDLLLDWNRLCQRDTLGWGFVDVRSIFVHLICLILAV